MHRSIYCDAEFVHVIRNYGFDGLLMQSHLSSYGSLIQRRYEAIESANSHLKGKATSPRICRIWPLTGSLMCGASLTVSMLM